MKIILKELVIATIIMVGFILMFSMFPTILHAGLFVLTLASIVLMYATKNTSLNIIGMFLIAGVIFSFILFYSV